jgi:Septum formation
VRPPAAAAVALALGLGAGALAACSGDDDGGDNSGDAGAGTTSTAATAIRSTAEEAPLDVGQCGLVADLRIGDALDPATVQTVDCAQPHDVEVIAVLDYPLDAGSPFPGTPAVDGYATDACIEGFEAYVGIDYLSSTLDVIVVAPGEEGWEEGDRRIACVVYDIDFADLVGSVAGTAR